MDKLLKYVRPKRVLDVGANIGSFSRGLLEKDPSCKIFMIEANPNCEPYLKSIGQPYDMVALGEKNGITELWVENSNPIGTGSSIFRENTIWYQDGKCNKIKVPMKKLDSCSYFGENQIDLIKLDVQGSELGIINGGEKTITQTPFVLVEVSLLPYNEGAPLIENVVERMIGLGFYIADIIEYHKIEKDIYFQLDLLFEKINKT